MIYALNPKNSCNIDETDVSVVYNQGHLLLELKAKKYIKLMLDSELPGALGTNDLVKILKRKYTELEIFVIELREKTDVENTTGSHTEYQCNIIDEESNNNNNNCSEKLEGCASEGSPLPTDEIDVKSRNESNISNNEIIQTEDNYEFYDEEIIDTDELPNNIDDESEDDGDYYYKVSSDDEEYYEDAKVKDNETIDIVEQATSNEEEQEKTVQEVVNVDSEVMEDVSRELAIIRYISSNESYSGYGSKNKADSIIATALITLGVLLIVSVVTIFFALTIGLPNQSDLIKILAYSLTVPSIVLLVYTLKGRLKS